MRSVFGGSRLQRWKEAAYVRSAAGSPFLPFLRSVSGKRCLVGESRVDPEADFDLSADRRRAGEVSESCPSAGDSLAAAAAADLRVVRCRIELIPASALARVVRSTEGEKRSANLFALDFDHRVGELVRREQNFAAVTRCKGGLLPVRLARKSRATLILASSMRPTRITSTRRLPRGCSQTTADRVTKIQELDTTTSAHPGKGRDRETAGRGNWSTTPRTAHRTMHGLPARRTVSAGSRHFAIRANTDSTRSCSAPTLRLVVPQSGTSDVTALTYCPGCHTR